MRFFHDSILLGKDRPKNHQEIRHYVDKNQAVGCQWSAVNGECEEQVEILLKASEWTIHNSPFTKKPNSEQNTKRSVATEA